MATDVQEEGDGVAVAEREAEYTPDPMVLKNLAKVDVPRDVDEAAVFGFHEEGLADLVERLGENGVDVTALLSDLAALDPDRLMRAHRAITYRIRVMQRRGEAEQRRIAARVEQLTRQDLRRLERVEGQLRGAAFQLRETTKGKVKSLSTLHGTVQTRVTAQSYEVPKGCVDEVLAFLEEHGMEALIRVKRELNLVNLKAVAQVRDGRVFVPCEPIGAPAINDVALPGVEVKPEAMGYVITHTWPTERV